MSFEIARELLMTAAKNVRLPFPVGFGGGMSPQEPGPWGVWWALQGDTAPAIIGRGHVRGVGILALQVFSRQESGEKVFSDAISRAARTLDAKQLNYQDRNQQVIVNLRNFGMGSETIRNGIRQRNMNCQFTRDTYRKKLFGNLTWRGIPITFGGIQLCNDQYEP